MIKHGVVLSAWSGPSVDFKSLKSSGIDFVILRAGFGHYPEQIDKFFRTNYSKAKDAGLGVGAYWYTYAQSVTDARSEVNLCLEVLDKKQFEYPIYCSLTDNSQSSLPPAIKTKILTTFCRGLRKSHYFAGIRTHGEMTPEVSPESVWAVPENPYLEPVKINNTLTTYAGIGTIKSVRGYAEYVDCSDELCDLILETGLNGFEAVHIERPTLKVGDKVCLKKDAYWETGKKVPNFFSRKEFYVRALSGEYKCYISIYSNGVYPPQNYINTKYLDKI